MLHTLIFLLFNVTLYNYSPITTAASKNNNNNLYYPPVHCTDETGTVVDWFIIYKLVNEDYNDLNYFYILPGHSKFIKPKYNIQSDNSLLAKTIAPLFKYDNISYIAYNDQPSKLKLKSNNNNFYGSDGHSNGLLLFNENHGVWIVHSIPTFPVKINNHHNLSNYLEESFNRESEVYAYDFGNLIFCMSIIKDEHLELIIEFVNIVHGNLFDYKILDNNNNERFMKQWRKLVGIKDKNSDFGTVENNYDSIVHRKLTLRNYTELEIFIKPAGYLTEIYPDIISPKLSTDLYVQSWSRNNKNPSKCSKYSVNNIVTKSINGVIIDSRDHSKWAVGTERDKPVVCVADVNNRRRNESSFGGLSICMHDEHLWSAFYNSVIEVEQC